MKIAVCCQSHYGTTTQYSQHIAQDLDAELLEQPTTAQLQGYDIIIYGGGLYAGNINGLKRFAKKYKALSDKKIVIFTVGLADPRLSQSVAPVVEAACKAFPTEAKNLPAFFHFRGNMNYPQLSFIHKAMMKIMKAILLKKGQKATESDKEVLASLEKPTTFFDPNSIAPLVGYVLGL